MTEGLKVTGGAKVRVQMNVFFYRSTEHNRSKNIACFYHIYGIHMGSNQERQIKYKGNVQKLPDPWQIINPIFMLKCFFLRPVKNTFKWLPSPNSDHFGCGPFVAAITILKWLHFFEMVPNKKCYRLNGDHF